MEIAATSSNPPASLIAPSRASFQIRGLISVPSVCVPRPWRIRAPELASRITTFTDWVDESTPATNFELDMGEG